MKFWKEVWIDARPMFLIILWSMGVTLLALQTVFLGDPSLAFVLFIAAIVVPFCANVWRYVTSWNRPVSRHLKWNQKQ